MSKWVVDIHGEIEGDYEIIGEYKEPKTGHWEDYWDEESRCYKYRCSECGKEQPFDTEFCWSCGKKMEKII